MTPIDLLTRAEKGSALTATNHDDNLTAIQTAVNALIAKAALIAADDGTLVDGALDTLAQITDNLLTLAKLAALTGDDKGGFLRADKTSGAIIAAQLFSEKDIDTTVVHSTNVQTGLSLTSLDILDVPAGDVLVWCNIMALRNGGANGGTLTLKNGSTVIAQVATHGLDAGTTQWMPFPLFGKLADFAGGTLTLDIEFETSEATSDVTFGVDGEGRFGRSIMVLAGL